MAVWGSVGFALPSPDLRDEHVGDERRRLLVAGRVAEDRGRAEAASGDPNHRNEDRLKHAPAGLLVNPLDTRLADGHHPGQAERVGRVEHLAHLLDQRLGLVVR